MTNNIGQPTALSDRPYLVVLNSQGQVLQFELTQQQHVLGRDRTRIVFKEDLANSSEDIV